MTRAEIRRRVEEAVCFLALPLAIFFLYRILPLLWSIVLSFERWSPLRPAHWEGRYFYREMLASDTFWTALGNTLIFIASAAIAIAIALVSALLVTSDLKGAAIYRTIVFLSYPLMSVAVAIIWNWLFKEKAGLINYVLLSIGIISKPIPFLRSFFWASPSM